MIENETSPRTICIVLGIGKFINYLETVKSTSKEDRDEDDEIVKDEDADSDDYDDDEDYEEELSGDEKFENIMKNATKNKNITFIIVDTEQRIRERVGDTWYSENIIQDNMMWVGNGIDDQFLLETNGSRKEIENECGPCFGYVNKKDRITLVKLLEMKEKREEDE